MENESIHAGLAAIEVADDGSPLADWLDDLRTRKAVKEKPDIK